MSCKKVPVEEQFRRNDGRLLARVGGLSAKEKS